MSALALGPIGHSSIAFIWPEERDSLRLPRGPVSDALVGAVLRNEIGVGSKPAAWLRPLASEPRVIAMNAEAGKTENPGPRSALALDVLLIVLDLLQRGCGVAAVNVRTVLDRKGYRRWGGERRLFERKVLGCLGMIQRLALETEPAEPLLRFAPRNVARTDFWVRAAPALAVELGDDSWAEIDHRVLRLDHRHNRGVDVLAKKLAVVMLQTEASGQIWIADVLKQAGFAAGGRRTVREGQLSERLMAALGRLGAMRVCNLDRVNGVDRSVPWRRNSLDAGINLGRAVSLRPLAERPPPSAVSLQPSCVIPLVPSRRGRPRFTPTPDQGRLVESLCRAGATRAQIAKAVGVSLPTLRRYFTDHLGADCAVAAAANGSASAVAGQ